MNTPPARVAVRKRGVAVVFAQLDEDPQEVRVRWSFRGGWRCDAHGRTRTTQCGHVAAGVTALSAHLLTVDPRHAAWTPPTKPTKKKKRYYR